MMERPKELPIGIGERFHEERNKERLPALEVANTVLWVNPAFSELPFRLEEGKPTDLGLFFTARPPAPPPEMPRWKKFLGYEQPKQEKIHSPIVMPENEARSGLLGSVFFRDQEGRIYRDVDVKGLGRFRKGRKVIQVHPKTEFGEIKQAWGLHDYQFASRDRKYSEEFLKAGIRTYRIAAIVDLKEIIDRDGKKISIDKAKKRTMLPSDMEPVVEVRAFGSRERIEYLGTLSDWTEKRSMLSLEDARTMVAQELGIKPDDFSYEDYLLWFAENLGKGVAKIRKLGLYHSYLTEHNVALDCRLVDLDSVATLDEWRKDEKHGKSGWSDEQFYSADFDRASSALATLVRSVGRLTKIPQGDDWRLESKVLKTYERAYKDELDIPRQENI